MSITRRSFLQFLGLAPAIAAVPALGQEAETAIVDATDAFDQQAVTNGLDGPIPQRDMTATEVLVRDFEFWMRRQPGVLGASADYGVNDEDLSHWLRFSITVDDRGELLGLVDKYQEVMSIHSLISEAKSTVWSTLRG